MTSEPGDADASETQSPPGERRWATRLTIAGFLALVLVPVFARQAPREVSQWFLAAAIRERADGRNQEARQRVDQALRWNSANADAWLALAKWQGEDRDFAAALESCNQAAAIRADDLRIYYERSQILQHLGRGADAVSDWKTIQELNEQRERMSSGQVWNGLAYARAVANIELDAALADAERAVAQDPDRAEQLDTRGFILYRLGRFEEARRDLERAGARYEKLWTTLKEQADVGNDSALEPDQRERLEHELALAYAVILYHRSLVRDALDDRKGAEEDRKLVRTLGFVPDESLF